jgi:hypothetical protein
MVGAFGSEAGEHYDVSIKAGERVLLPAVRQSLQRRAGDCQRLQLPRTDHPVDRRQPLLLAEVIDLAMRTS